MRASFPLKTRNLLLEAKNQMLSNIIHKELISLGFLDRDNQIDLEYLKQRTKERLIFPEIIYQGSILHPITFIYHSHDNAKLISTKDFIANPLSAVNC